MNRSRKPGTTQAFRLHPLHVMLAALALLLPGLAAPAGAVPGTDNRAPELVGDCQKLQVEAGNKVVAYLYGRGVQIYRWDGTSWKFVAPQAVLFADAGEHSVVCNHFGGPTWQSLSGSTVVGAVDKFCTPDPDSIPWLLLHATSTQGPGIFANVTFIQRVNTVGGLAPADPGDFIGEVAQVPYSADYVFYH